MMRSRMCAEVSERHVGQRLTLAGWMHARRDHGGVLFVDLRDRSGLVQIVFDPANKELFAEAETLREHRRLFYVALTRARDRLYICGFENKKGVKQGSWYELARSAAERLGVKVTRGDGEITAIGTVEEEVGEREKAVAEKSALPGWISARAPLEPASPRLIRMGLVIAGIPMASMRAADCRSEQRASPCRVPISTRELSISTAQDIAASQTAFIATRNWVAATGSSHKICRMKNPGS